MYLQRFESIGLIFEMFWDNVINRCVLKAKRFKTPIATLAVVHPHGKTLSIGESVFGH